MAGHVPGRALEAQAIVWTKNNYQMMQQARINLQWHLRNKYSHCLLHHLPLHHGTYTASSGRLLVSFNRTLVLGTPTSNWYLISHAAVTAILSGVFLFALDQTIVADVQPNIIAQFGSIDKLPWLSVAFLLATASTNLFW
jgi:hypothetical protein